MSCSWLLLSSFHPIYILSSFLSDRPPKFCLGIWPYKNKHCIFPASLVESSGHVMCSERKYWLQLLKSVPKGRGQNLLYLFCLLAAGWNGDMMAGVQAAILAQEVAVLCVIWQSTKVDWGWVSDSAVCHTGSGPRLLDLYMQEKWVFSYWSHAILDYLSSAIKPSSNIPTTMSLNVLVLIHFLTFHPANPYWSFRFVLRHHFLNLLIISFFMNPLYLIS